MPGIDERLTQDLERLGKAGRAEGWDPEGAFDRIAAKKVHRRTARRIEAASLVFVVLLATVAGSYGLVKVLGLGRASRPHPAGPAAASINGRIAFVRSDATDGVGAIYTMNPDGTDVVRLSPQDLIYLELAWSLDGTKLAFSALEPGSAHGSDIYVMQADGTGVTRLTHDGAENGQPAWSPDGARIAFVASPKDQPGLFVMNADGTGQARLTTRPDASPTWSPDGAEIMFVTSPEGRPEIHAIAPDGSGDHVVASPAQPGGDTMIGDLFEARWSPDGTRIVFVQVTQVGGDKNYEIYVMDADGSGSVDLTNTYQVETMPAWSPDGRMLAFVRDDQVYVMNADGSNARPLTNGARNAWPAWQRAPASASVSTPTEPSPSQVPASPSAKCQGYQVTGDFDGDGKPDTAISNSSPPEAGAECPGSGLQHEGLGLTVELSAGGLVNTHVIDRCDGFYCGSLREGDLNGDGKAEIAYQVGEGAATAIYEIFGVVSGQLREFTVAPPGTVDFPAGDPLQLVEGSTVTHGDFLQCASASPGTGLVFATSAERADGSSNANWTMHETTLRFDGESFAVADVRDFTAKGTPPDGLPPLHGDDCFPP